MYERFTNRARKVMSLATEQAKHLNHEYIGPEHILLGLVKEGSGVGANVLKNLDVDLKRVWLEVEKIVKSGPDTVYTAKLPQTPRAKRVIEFAIEEARNLNHNYVGSEHLLLGLLREHEGVAAHVLLNLNLKLEDVREEVLNILGSPPEHGGLMAPMAPLPLQGTHLKSPPPSKPAEYTLMPHRLSEAWINLAIGGLLLFLMPNTPRYLLSLAHLAQPPLPMMDGTPYGQSLLVLPDAAVAAFAGVMILAGLIFLIAPRRPMLMLVGVLMAAAVLFNIAAIVARWSEGFQIICAIAVAVGGYEVIYLLGLLGMGGKE